MKPYYDTLQVERTELAKRYKDEILRNDNLVLRMYVVRMFTLAIFFGSMLIHKKGYVRYSLRNGLFAYGMSSYLLVP